MDINELKILAAQKLGIDQLNPMQLKASQAMQQSAATVLLAPTGSGKTLGFALGLLQRMRPGDMAVILAPSRELAAQIAEVVRPIAQGLKTTLITGGRPVADEAASLSVRPDIIVATPGRLLDHANRGHIDLGHTRELVVDEYDKVLELGFADEMGRLTRKMGQLDFMALTSATSIDQMPDFIKAKPVILDFSRASSRPRNRMVISRVESPSPDKLQTLSEVLDAMEPGKRAIVFANHRESVERIYDYLKQQGYAAALYHGGLDQNDRENALERLTNGSVSVLASTDLAGRGVDLAGGVDAVIHYHLPPTAQSWTHRNGRTARVDAPGEVYVITSERENIPDYVTWDREGCGAKVEGGSRQPLFDTLYFNLGRKEKISRGDVVGFLTAHGIPGTDIGRIALRDHNVLAAVKCPAPDNFKGEKIKGKTVRISKMG